MTRIFCKTNGNLRVFEASERICHNVAKDLLLSSNIKPDGAIMLEYF